MLLEPATVQYLASGLAVITVPMPHTHTASVGVYVRGGSLFETEKTSGLTHFLEHMLFRGNKRYCEPRSPNGDAEDLGTHIDASTGLGSMVFHLRVVPSKVRRAVHLLADLVSAPRFSNIDQERAVVLEEINEEFDEKGVSDDTSALALAAAYPKHSLGRAILGFRENVRSFSRRDLLRHRDLLLVPRNMALVVAGPVSAKNMVVVARSAFDSSTWGGNRLNFPLDVHPRKPTYVHHAASDGPQTSMSLVFRGPTVNDPDFTAFERLVCLMDGMSSPLYRHVVEQQGLAYSVSADIEPLPIRSLLTITASTSHAKVPRLLQAILLELRRLTEVRDSDVAFRRASAQDQLTVPSMQDSPYAMASWYGERFVGSNKSPSMLATSFRTFVDNMRKVDASAVRAVARKVFRSENISVATRGQLSKKVQASISKTISSWRRP